MKIAVQVNTVPHYFAARLRAFLSRKVEMLIVSTRDTGDFSGFVYAPALATLPIVSLNQRRLIQKCKAIEHVLDEYDPDVVVVAGWASPESYLAIAAARRRGRRLVMMSESQAEDHSRSEFREVVKSSVIRYCDAALVGGESHRDYIVSLGMPKANIFLGYDAVDNAYFENGATRARENPDAVRSKHSLPGRYLLASARFIPKKNLLRLVEAFATATVGIADCPHLVILGDGPERPAIEAAIAHTGCSNKVLLPGFQSYDVLPDYYALADGFVHVSTTEQWGLVVNEATAAGLAILLSRSCGAAKHLVHDGENGFLVNPTDIEDIVSKLRLLMNLLPQHRSAMGAMSQKIVADWGPKRFADGLFAACEMALKQPPRRLRFWDELLLSILAQHHPREVE